MACRGQHSRTNVSALGWYNSAFPVEGRKNQGPQRAAEWPNDRMDQKRCRGPGEWAELKKYSLLVKGCSETEWNNTRTWTLKAHAQFQVSTQNKSILLKTTFLLSLNVPRGPWSLVTWVLVCVYHLCQRSRHSLKTLGMQLKNQRSRVDCVESLAALDEQDICYLMPAQFLSSWVAWSTTGTSFCGMHTLYLSSHLLNSQEQRAGPGIVISPRSLSHPGQSPSWFALCYPTGPSSSFSSILVNGGQLPAPPSVPDWW